ncbi:hypothetical protein [Nocardia sp. CA-119907]|uniref:hypothetical protein n=1 Tax=Nocardia sp. CA-119907 TaxID=3239973 RepID=UPI003D96AC15
MASERDTWTEISAGHSAAAGDGEFADRLDRLITEWETGHGRPLQYRTLAEALARSGQTTSGSYVSMLRHGHRCHPRFELIEALADFFGADPYWLGTGLPRGERRTDISVIATVSDDRLRRLLRTAVDLSAPSLSILADLAERIRPGDTDLPKLRYTARLTDLS